MTESGGLRDCWQGRVDIEDAERSRRLHQQVEYEQLPANFVEAPVLIGFATDAGVRRNQGRPGAKEGPDALRRALANLCCSPDFRCYDLGNVVCSDDALEAAQRAAADAVTAVLDHGGRPFVLGGGHEIGWSGFLGVRQYLQERDPGARLGILNLDAHFDLRNPRPVASSGTPFRQAQQWCEANECDFHYFVVGISPSANSDALFEFAVEHDVQWIEDLECHWLNLEPLQQRIAAWIADIDALYLTLCLDVFPAADAPGVSAPAGVGVEPRWALKLLQFVRDECERTGAPILLADVAELNPSKDIDDRTARLAASYLYQLII